MRFRQDISTLSTALIMVLMGLCVWSCRSSAVTVGGSGGVPTTGTSHVVGGVDGGIVGGGAGGIRITLPVIGFGGATGTGGIRTATSQPWPPPGYVNVTKVSYGAYALNPKPLASPGPGTGAGGSAGTSGSGGDATGTCGGLFGVVRDFRMAYTDGGHPDFQRDPIGDDLGIVEPDLGSDGKPVYAHPGGSTMTTTGARAFAQWYRDVPGVNMSYLVGLHFVQNGNVLTFAASIGNTGVDDSSYFPLDDYGFGDQYQEHNFSFTTEIHTNFTYNGGEVFTFQGDDDVWVFINNRLAIDLGGIHGQETGTVDLDGQASALGITKGKVYPLAVFNAERHTSQSNFRVDTTMVFTNCGLVDGVSIIF